MKRNLKRLPIFALAALSVVACSSLDPYVDARIERPGFRDATALQAATGLTPPASPTEVTISEVRRYARSLHDAYVRAVAQQERLNIGSQLSLIPLAATAAGLGITGGSTDAITVLGLTGAGLTVAGTVAVNEERQRIYLAGARALTCIQDLANDFDAALPFATQFNQGGAGTPAIGRLVTALLRLEVALETLNPNQRQRARAAAAQQAANATLNSAYAIRSFVNVPGQILLYRVDEIQDLVNRLVQGASVDLTTFASTLTGRLGALQGQIVPMVEEPAIGGQELFGQESRPPTNIEQAIAEVEAAHMVLARLVAATGVTLDLTDRSCVSDFPNTRNALAVSPSDGITVTGTEGDTFAASIIVSGGVPPYGIIHSDQITSVERTPMGRSRERFQLTIRRSPNTYNNVVIFDANDQQVPLEIPIAQAE